VSEVLDHLDTFHALQTNKERRHKEEVWEEIDNNLGFQSSGDGSRNIDLIADGGPQLALQTYKTGLMGRIMQPRLDWFTFGIEDEDLMKQRDVRMWISRAVQGCNTLIGPSNLFTQMPELFGVGGRLGTGTLYRYWDEVQKREVFLLQDTWEIYLAENDADEVDTVYRYCIMTAQKLVQKFGQDNVDSEVLRMYNDPDTRFHEYRVLHAVEPNPNYDPRRKDTKSKRYLSSYIDITHEKEMRSGGYAVMPYATWRVEKPPKEVYGRGPGWRALSDIKALYLYTETDLTGVQMNVQPVVGLPEEQRGRVPWVPGGKWYYEDAGRDIKESQPRDIRQGLEREVRKQQIIDMHFLVPQFSMMQRLGMDPGDKATLGHVARIEEEIAVHLGPQIAGFNQDVMDKILDGVFADAYEAGLIPPPPKILTESQKNKRLETIYLGPLAQAQRRFTQQEPYRRALANVAAMLQMDPSGQTIKVLDNYDLDHITREMSKADGLPEEALLEERVRDRLRDARAKQAKEQQELAAMETMGKPGMTKAIEPGSLIEKMGKAKQATAVAP